MRKVSDILKRKGNKVSYVSPTVSVVEALEIMAEHNIGSLVVLERDSFIGIITERDYSRKIVLMGKSSSDTPVSEIMSTEFPSILPTDTVEKCMQLMTTKRIRYLPVIENGKLTGIVSMHDVVLETILNQQETISHLQSYIQS
ncbi:MAG: CBS domain-containing protein [Bacteroidota bacterium]